MSARLLAFYAKAYRHHLRGRWWSGGDQCPLLVAYFDKERGRPGPIVYVHGG